MLKKQNASLRNSVQKSKTRRVGDKFELPEFIPRARYSTYGCGRFPDRDEMSAYFKQEKANDSSIRLDGVTAILEDRKKNGYDVLQDRSLYFSRDVLTRNIMITGQTGSGKTQKLIYPFILGALRDPERSCVIVGGKGDEYEVVRAICEKYRPNSRVECINFGDANSTTSPWNPFAGGSKDREGAARDHAETLLLAQSAGQGDHDNCGGFFHKCAVCVISGILLFLERKYGVARPKDLFAICSNLDRLTRFFKLAKRLHLAGLDEYYDQIVDGASPNFATIVAEVNGNLFKLADENVGIVTSVNEFKFDMLFDEPTVLVLEVTQDVQSRIAPFLAMFFKQLFSAVSARARANRSSGASRLPRPLSIVMDDFTAAVGRVQKMGDYINMMRSTGVETIFAVQSREQLWAKYDPAEAYEIVNGCNTKIYLAGVGVRDAEYASAEGGYTTIALNPQENGAVSTPRASIGFGAASRKVHAAPDFTSACESPYSRPLLLADDIRFAPKHKEYGPAATFFLPGCRPFQAWLPSAYQLSEMQEFFEKAKSYPKRVVRPGSKLERAINESKGLIKPSYNLDRDLNDENFQFPKKDEKPIGQRISEYLVETKFDDASPNAKRWWHDLEHVYAETPKAVERYLRALVARGATIQDFYEASLDSGSQNNDVTMKYLDFKIAKARHEELLKRRAQNK